MKLYKYVTPQRIDVVRDVRIRFTPPGYLCDPFECRLVFNLPTDKENDEAIRLWRKWASFEWGILCLTKRPDNFVMWAHYAAAHRGFLLEFDSENIFFNAHSVDYIDWLWFGEGPPFSHPGFGNIRDVDYTQQRPYTDNAEEIPLDSFFTKSKDWEYEEEVRMIFPIHTPDFYKEKDIHLFKFPPEALTGIILGAGANERLKNRFKNLIKENELNHVKLYKAKLNLHDFGMVFNLV